MKQITQQRLYNITIHYLERYDSTSFKIKQMLKKRIQKEALKGAIIPQDVDILINQVIQKTIHLGYLDDTRYLTNKIRYLSQKGKSSQFIVQYLTFNGFKKNDVLKHMNNYHDETGQTDLERAKIWLKQHKKGPFRTKNHKEFFQKDLQSLARNGFSYDIAINALKHEE